jgi:hypothetical protein
MKNKLMICVLAGLMASLGLTYTSPARAGGLEATGGYMKRPLTLPRGRLRIDAAPSDYGYMDFGRINNGRGFDIIVQPGPEVVYLGAGAALGVIDNLEVGLLALPIQMSPGDFRDLEAYGRYQFLDGKFQLAGQATMMIPTGGQFGIGLGLPAIISLSDRVRIDTGLEFEILTTPGRFNLDIPAAFAFSVTDNIFVGPRTGIRVDDFDGMAIPLGVFAGGTVADIVDISGSFTWNNFLYAGNALDTFNLDYVEITVGATMFLDVF